MSSEEVVNNSGFTSYDKNYDYCADDAEAVVYIVFESGFTRSALYVMKRSEAMAFCARPETCGTVYGKRWFYAFTTHLDNSPCLKAEDSWFCERCALRLTYSPQALIPVCPTVLIALCV